METDVLKEAASWYQTIEGKKYCITIQKKKDIQDLTIYFPTEAFLHLSGLHKLKDIPIVQRSAKTVYKEILDEKITYQDLACSQYINEIKDRLYYFPQIYNIIKTDSLYFKSLHGKFKGISADFLLTKNIDTNQFGFLFFVKESTDHCPCSFFNRNEKTEYTKDGTRWTITNIIEIKKT